MFQRGRPEQEIKYKQEVLKSFPDAKWVKQLEFGAIMNGKKRISEVYRVAWKAWESAWHKLQNPSQ